MSHRVCPGYGSSVFRYSKHGVSDAVLEYDPDRSNSQKHFRPRFAYSPRILFLKNVHHGEGA